MKVENGVTNGLVFGLDEESADMFTLVVKNFQIDSLKSMTIGMLFQV